MNKTYITHARWAVTGEMCDVCINPDILPLRNVDGIELPCEPFAPAGTLPIPEGARVIDAGGKLLLPALFDLHAKIEIEGCGKREAVMRTGQAANKGGVWGMLVMPTPGFTFDNADKLDSFRDMVAQRSAVEMYPAGCISVGCDGEQQAPYNTLAARGVSILSDAERVPSNLLMLYRSMSYVAELGLTLAIRGDVPSLTAKTCIHPSATSYRLGLHGSPACAEEIGLETIIRLARATGAKLHLQTVSTAEGVSIIRRAKEEGADITAETTIHHLLYTHADVGEFDTTFKTLPPLRDARDRDALLEGVKDGVIDCIVSDHTPCSPFAKKQDFITAPQGMVWLDVMLPALYTHLIKPSKLTWAELIRACCINPVRIAAPRDVEEDMPTPTPLLLFDPQASFTVGEDSLCCGALNSPLLGSNLQGAVTLPL